LAGRPGKLKRWSWGKKKEKKLVSNRRGQTGRATNPPVMRRGRQRVFPRNRKRKKFK